MRLSEPTTKIWMKIDPYYQQQKCRPMTLVFGGVRLVRIFAEVFRGGCVKRQWGCRQRQFSALSLAIFFGYFRNEANVIIWRYAIMHSVVGFSVIPKCKTLNDPERLFHVKFCFLAGLASWDRATSENNCVKTNKETYAVSGANLRQGLVSGI